MNNKAECNNKSECNDKLYCTVPCRLRCGLGALLSGDSLELVRRLAALGATVVVVGDVVVFRGEGVVFFSLTCYLGIYKST